MHHRRKLLIPGSLLLVLTLALTGQLAAQERGLDLFNKLMRERRSLVSYEGERNVRWTPAGDAYIVSKDNTFWKVNPETGAETPLFDDAKIIAAYNGATGENKDKLPFRQFDFVEDGAKIRFYEDGRTKVFFYDLTADIMTAFKVQEPTRGVRGAQYEEVFSPDYKYTAYVDDYNLYLRDIEKDKISALTTDGHEDLRNGYPDWVYAEEFGHFNCYWWSPNSDKVAYMQFDESPVRKFPVLHDETYDFELEMQSYPRVGENNPIIRFFIVDVKTKKQIQLDAGIETNVYLLNGRWSYDGSAFTFKRMNRLQNKVEILKADPETGATTVLFSEEEPKFITEGIGFMNEGNEIYFLPDNKHFLRTSERTGWRELYLYENSGKLVRQLTNAKLPIAAIEAVDMENGWVYFSGYENRGLEQHLYRVTLKGKQFTNLTKTPGTHRVSVSPNGTYFSDNFSSFDTPAQFTIYKGDGTFVKQLGKTVLADELNELGLVEPEHFVFTSADGMYDLDGILYKPAGFDETKKYPVLYSIYMGPSTKAITNSNVSLDFMQGLTQLGFLIVNIDNRGLIHRGKEFEAASYGKLGQTDVEDLVASIEYLIQRPYVDSTRVGIFGGSYGGYMSIMALLKAPEHFHVAVAGSPGVDWRNYDTIYTERYMGLPMYNRDGYEKANPMNYVNNLQGKLLIQHGAVDDNVHPTQVMQLVDALLKAGKDFDWFMYPGMAHGIRYQQSQMKMFNWFIKHLEPETKDAWFAQF
ncbi:DPP IV N-terminal domain-containing protein [bacterium]|nr:DPP IV N-terminal domain-containing protein [bacterium]